MDGHVVIVEAEASERAALRTALGLSPDEVREIGDPAQLPAHAAAGQAALAILGLGRSEEAGLDALRRLRATSGAPRLPVIALVPQDRPDLRLAALRAGAEEAAGRDTAPRVLQSRLRSLLRHHEGTLEMLDEGPLPASPGLAEAPMPFLAADSSRRGPSHRVRVGVLSPRATPGSPPLHGLDRLLGAEVTPLCAGGGPFPAAQGLDLVVIDALGTTGDLQEGARVLAMLAELQGRAATRDAATLVLLPSDAVETAALALDLGAGDVAVDPVGPEEVALRARALLGRKAQAEHRRDQLRSQLRAAVTDPLTGLHNLHHADPELRRMARSAGRDGGSLAVMMLDIDHFKSFNDRYGHATGNRVLIEVARRLKAGLRPGDLLARIGGEEFLVALPGASLPEARAVAERLRRAVSERPFVIDLGGAVPSRRIAPQSFAGLGPETSDGGPLRVRVTLSIGVAAASAGDLAAGISPDDLLARADGALYAAKAAGRDAVATAPSGGQAAFAGAEAAPCGAVAYPPATS